MWANWVTRRLSFLLWKPCNKLRWQSEPGKPSEPRSGQAWMGERAGGQIKKGGVGTWTDENSWAYPEFAPGTQ